MNQRAEHQPSTPRSRFICAILLLLAVRCLAAAAYRGAVAPGSIFIGDFGVYYAAAQRLAAGQSLYMPEHGRLLMQHVSSPLIPVLARPLTLFPLEQATRYWAALNVSLLAGAVGLFSWGIGLVLPDDTAQVLLALFCGFRYWPTTIELGVGNSDMLLLALACGMFVCARYRKWMLFAALAAVAALTKTWMIGMLFYLLIRRQWMATAAGVGFFAGGLALLLSLTGWRELHGLAQMTYHYSSQPTLISNSVAGIARMYFTKNLVLTPLWESRIGWALVLLLGYGALVGGLACLWWRGPRMNEAQFQMALAMMPLALILGSPISHQFYFVLALPVIWLLLIGPEYGCRLRLGAFLVYVLLSIPYAGLNPAPENLRHGIASLQIGESFFCGMALWGMALWAVLRETNAPAAAEEAMLLEEAAR